MSLSLSLALADDVELHVPVVRRFDPNEWGGGMGLHSDDDRIFVLFGGRRHQSGKKHDRRQLGVIPYQDNLLRVFRNTLVDKFLPNDGYPDSVGEGYAKYSGLSFIGTTGSSIIMVLSAQGLFQAVGLSDGVAL